MLKTLGDSLKQTFKKIAGFATIDKETVEAIIRDLQRTLLRSDVDVSLVAELSKRIKEKVLEEKLPPGLSVKEHFIKTLYDEIVSFLGEDKAEIKLSEQRILLIGLFGSGKTTTAGKLARWFKIRGLSVGLVACDMHRAAAQEQLIQLAEKIGINVYTEGKDPESIAKNALKKAKESVLIFDSAGRDALDKELAQELKELKDIIKPDEIFLVVPADIGQDAGRQASEFNRLVGITGIIVTKLDGTAKGGGALSSSAVSGAKVKFIGTGERLEDLEVYDPKRFVSRLIGYGDIQGLLERAKEVGIDEESAKKMIERFTLEDFVNQISQVRKMGSLSRITEMIPGFSNLKIPTNVLDVQEERMKKWEHIVKSMTPEERENPDIINFSRVKRIARGSGTSESEVRNLLKNYKQVRKLMKMTKTGGLRRGMLGRFARQFGLKV